MGIPKQHVGNGSQAFAVAASRLEIRSVRKPLLRVYGRFHPDCADCSFSLSALFRSHRLTQPEPRRQKSHHNPSQTCSQRPTQMAVLSAWQASWDPSDPHGVVGLNTLSTQQHTSLNWHVCVFFFLLHLCLQIKERSKREQVRENTFIII